MQFINTCRRKWHAVGDLFCNIYSSYQHRNHLNPNYHHAANNLILILTDRKRHVRMQQKQDRNRYIKAQIESVERFFHWSLLILSYSHSFSPGELEPTHVYIKSKKAFSIIGILFKNFHLIHLIIFLLENLTPTKDPEL